MTEFPGITSPQSPSPKPLGRLLRVYLLLLVMLTGAVVLSLEILGTRVIGTHYGSSLYVWAALLTVTLVCLSAGYAIGGCLADRLPQPAVLFVLVMLAGLSILLVPTLTIVLEPIGDRFGLEWGATLSALIVFFLPLTLLAMSSPYVIRLRARRVEGVGATSGAVYALSTVGSVAGVLTVSMWMVPRLGTTMSLVVCAGVLVCGGGIGLLLALRSRWKAAGLAALFIAAAAVHFAPRTDPPVANEIFPLREPIRRPPRSSRRRAAARRTACSWSTASCRPACPRTSGLSAAARSFATCPTATTWSCCPTSSATRRRTARAC